MSRGGKRAGSGVKEGSIRPHISQYWTQEQIKDFYQSMYKRQKKSDRIAVWCGDQLSGKAVQPIGNEDNRPFMVKFDNAFSPLKTT